MAYITRLPLHDTPWIPQSAPVERGERRAHDVDVPSKIWVLPIPGLATTIMIREEYQETMHGLLRWMEHRTTVGLERTIKQEHECMTDVDLSNTLEEPPAPGDLGVVHASHPLSDLQDYPNPFIGKNGVTTSGGVVLTGLAGIGKSSFLWVLFNLRSAAGLPTLYLLDSPASTILWKDGESYRIDMNRITCYELWNILPTDTWCLIDSLPVPEALVNSDRFILQTASPSRTESMRWMRKVKGTCYFIMKPWDLGELIAGRQCQQALFRNFNRDETYLAEFYHQYGGSARDAYSFAHRMKEFDVSLELAFSLLQPNSLRTAFCTEPSRFIPESTYDLLSYFPVDDRNRTLWTLDSPSPQLRKRLLSRIHTNSKYAQKAWFYLNLHGSPGSKAVAARLYDGFYHKRIICGGSWTLWRMITNEKRTWRIAEEGPRVLVANGVISIEDDYLADTPASLQERNFDDWPVHEHFEVGVYYHSQTQRKFAFFVDGVGHAIVFTSRRYEGKAWLEERGISKVTYVYVTPEKAPLSLPLELKMDSGFYDSVYCMDLEYEADVL